jgi:hypothetical protein
MVLKTGRNVPIAATKMKLHITEITEFGDEAVFEWIGSDKRFILWFDEKECDAIFVTKNWEDPDGDYAEKLNAETLEKMYDRIGRILKKETK